MVPRSVRSTLAGIAALAIGLASASAAGAGPKPSEHYAEGIALEESGKWGRALAAYEKAAALEDTAVVRFHMARVKEQLGRLADALEDARLAEQMASTGDPMSEIQELRAWLEARVPHVTIVLGEGMTGAALELDDQKIDAAALGGPIPVDPGSHRIDAVLEDGAEFTKTFSVGAGEQEEVALERPAGLAPAPRATPKPRPPPRRAPKPKPKPEPGADEGSTVLPWIIGGVGVASLAASGVFIGLRSSAVAKLDEGCDDSLCPESLKGTQSDAETYALLVNVTAGVGIAGIGVATVMLLASGSDADESAARDVAIAANATPGAASVTVHGRF